MWTELFKREEYTFWKNNHNGTPYFNVTKDGKPPNCDGGYYNLTSLLKTKGIKK